MHTGGKQKGEISSIYAHFLFRLGDFQNTWQQRMVCLAAGSSKLLWQALPAGLRILEECVGWCWRME